MLMTLLMLFNSKNDITFATLNDLNNYVRSNTTTFTRRNKQY